MAISQKRYLLKWNFHRMVLKQSSSSTDKRCSLPVIKILTWEAWSGCWCLATELGTPLSGSCSNPCSKWKQMREREGRINQNGRIDVWWITYKAQSLCLGGVLFNYLFIYLFICFGGRKQRLWRSMFIKDKSINHFNQYYIMIEWLTHNLLIFTLDTHFQ